MPEETTPLLSSSQASVHDHEQGSTEAPHNAIYDRFSKGRKRVIVALISFCGLLPLFVSGSFFPSIPSISRDMNTSLLCLTVSVSVFASCVGALFGASYSGFYGRKPIYLVGLPLLTLGSIGVAFSRTMPELMLWRFLQTFGGSPGLSIGAGVIGDIYVLEQRGAAMGIFFGACLFGPALAPLMGGVLSHYASWRITQLFLGVLGLLAFISIATLYPETIHSRDERNRQETCGTYWFGIVWINPLKTMALLKSPNLLAVALAETLVLLTDYVMLTPLSITVGERYGITNQAILGACFIPIGLGNFIGAPLAGHLSDRILKRKRIASERAGVENWYYPEDRLLGTLFALATLVPLSVLGMGLITTYVEGKLGLWLVFVCLFVNGLGVDLVLSPSAAYIIDVMHTRSAESMAANNGLRSFLIAILLAALMPMLDRVGLVWTNALAALLAWLGFGLLWLTVRYGERMRAWIDVGYTTTVE
ncbi:MFS general substrate transporter [Gymnopus androsaceus JB14]|uniref:MFS general substrate transporter n=1 Tax=Gymnopus androsaceus JB14 TaxID=1447944 RepID=A0A6A4GNG8_9AGAR|nr:MFS general substrate transporter [Gymnopus androsaceus JB14]